MPSALSPWAWAVAAVVIAFLELLVPGSYLIWIAFAAALTALAAFAVALSLSAQLAIFAGACIVCCVAGYFVYRGFANRPHDSDAINRRDLDLIGQSAAASEAFVNGHGRVRLDDTLWLAESASGAAREIAAGTAVRITAVRGTTLIVAPKAD